MALYNSPLDQSSLAQPSLELSPSVKLDMAISNAVSAAVKAQELAVAAYEAAKKDDAELASLEQVAAKHLSNARAYVVREHPTLLRLVLNAWTLSSQPEDD